MPANRCALGCCRGAGHWFLHGMRNRAFPLVTKLNQSIPGGFLNCRVPEGDERSTVKLGRWGLKWVKLLKGPYGFVARY